jgi:8-oxo-dGTP pyrophosphatase MutT (NUDIX family)
MHHIRPIAICVFRRDDRILVAEGYDPVKDEYFYRPLGGGIEFGENSRATICREMLEELNLEVDETSLRYLGAVENVFTFNGLPGHEIVLIYDGEFKEARIYEHVLLRGIEANGQEIQATWKNLDDFGNEASILYPTGLLEMLR